MHQYCAYGTVHMVLRFIEIGLGAIHQFTKFEQIILADVSLTIDQAILLINFRGKKTDKTQLNFT